MKRGFISIHTLGRLRGTREKLQKIEGQIGALPLDVEELFCSIAFQGGFERFSIPAYPNSHRYISDYILRRSEMVEYDQIEEFDCIEQIFAPYYDESVDYIERVRSPIFSIEAFLIDLFSAMKTKSCLIEVNRIPKITELERLLPFHILEPIDSLLSQFRHSTAVLPRATSVFQRSDVERLREVIESISFKEYSLLHENLDDQRNEVSNTVERITKAGAGLKELGGNLLELRSTALGILPMTPKLVDIAFGKLPGAVAEVATKLGVSFLEDRKRVVVYSCGHVVSSALSRHLGQMMEKDPTIRY